MDSRVLLTNLYLKESTVLFFNPEEALKGGELIFSVSAENTSHQEKMFSLDFVFNVQAENKSSKLFEINCIFNSTFNVNNDAATWAQENESKLATICFSLVYQSIREHVSDVLRRMNLLTPINSLPYSIDFGDQNITLKPS